MTNWFSAARTRWPATWAAVAARGGREREQPLVGQQRDAAHHPADPGHLHHDGEQDERSGRRGGHEGRPPPHRERLRELRPDQRDEPRRAGLSLPC